jgi:hypothetical protein
MRNRKNTVKKPWSALNGSATPLGCKGCNQEEFKSFTQQWRLYAGCHGGMDVRELRQRLLNCTDGHLEAAMYDALGSKIDTLSETDMMEELEKLAVEEIN